MNSCIRKPLFACAPPLIIFINGYGNLKLFFTKKVLNKGNFFTLAESFFTAIDTAKIELAPSLVFCLVPSKLIKRVSILSWS